jgi:uncharacterized RDD family membrane protein YckC
MSLTRVHAFTSVEWYRGERDPDPPSETRDQMSDSEANQPTDGGAKQPPPPGSLYEATSGGQYGPPPGTPYETGGQYGPPPGGQYQGMPAGGYTPAPGYGYGPAATGGVGQPAGLGPRFLARLVDGILVGIVNAIIATVLLVAIFGIDGNGYGYGVGGSYAYSALTGVIGAAISLGYFALMESRRGQTLGKMLLKLQTQGPDGNRPSLGVAAKRNFWVALGVLSVVPFLGTLGGLAELVIVIVIAVTINTSPINEGWHDRLAGGTRVIKIG